jgi:hypothetical protein
MKIIHSVILFVILLGGCSSSTLVDTIKKTGRENIEILYQDDNDKVVLFLDKDFTGQPMLCLNNFSKENSKYEYDAGTGESAHNIDLSSKYEFVTVTSVGNSTIGAIWGGIFNYPNANIVEYTLKDEDGNVIHNSSVEITDKNIVYVKLPQEIYAKFETLHYKILDDENKVIVER